jgi:serine/threonine protein kinase
LLGAKHLRGGIGLALSAFGMAEVATQATRRDTPVRATVNVDGATSQTWSLRGSGAVGRYEIVGEIATGGMATVYVGRMRRPMGFSRLVAIKSMHPQYAKDPDFVSMFVDEARLTARVRHPNVVPTLDIVAEGDQLVIVMDYVEGETLGTLFKSVKAAGEQIPAPIACAIIHDLLLGLHEAHETRDEDGTPLAVIHRDVSPQNVIVGVDGLTRVLDFGVAKARRSVHNSLDGEIKGKIPYMPTEQLFGEEIDRRVDIYAAGVLLWESLSGVRLFDGPTDEALVSRIAGDRIDPPSAHAPDISPELDQLVLRALSRERADRFATALSMAERLAEIARVATRTEVAAWIKRFTRRREIPSSQPPPRDSIGTAVVDTLHRVSTTPPVEERRPFPALIAVAAVALVLGAAGVGWRARGASVPEQHATTAATTTAQSSMSTAMSTATSLAARPAAAIAPAAAAPEAAPSEKPAPAHHAKPAAPRTAEPAARVNVAIAAKPTAAPAADVPAPAPAPAAVETKPAVSCRPPYTVDAEGHRHYKVECL